MADAGGFDYWRGGEQAPLPAEGSDAGGFDYWRGGELLPVYSKEPVLVGEKIQRMIRPLSNEQARRIAALRL